MSSLQAFPNGQHDLNRGIDFIGVSCSFHCHDGQGNFVLHKRSKNCRDEQGKWDCGGGAHEFGATLEETVRREIKEEYGATVKELQFLKVYDAHRHLDDGRPTHWVNVLFAVLVNPNEITNNEPAKIDAIKWCRVDSVPENQHSQLAHTLASAQQAGII